MRTFIVSEHEAMSNSYHNWGVWRIISREELSNNRWMIHCIEWED